MTINRTLRPPAPYFGGKFGTIGTQIAGLIDQIPHRIYVEPFGGMAGVLFLKKPSLIEVYNDIDSRLFNLFKVLRDKKKAAALKKQLKLTPFSREEYLFSQKMIKGDCTDDVEYARATIVCLSQSIQPSLRHNGFKNGGKKYETNTARQFQKRAEGISAITERFANVVIENIPAERLIVRFDDLDTLIYLDPPYVQSTRNLKTPSQAFRKDYSYEMDDNYHKVLLLVAKGLKSKVIISGYNNDLYNDMLADWHRIDIETTSFIAGSQTNPGDISMKRTEVLWSNFQFNPQLKMDL